MSSRQAPASQQPTPTLLVNGGIAPGPHRLHPSYVALSALRAIASIILVAFISMLSILSTLTIAAETLFFVVVIALSIIVLLVLVAVFSYLSYKRFLWEITDNDIHIYSGIIFKQQVHIPFQRVQSIDFQAGIIERILGIVKLKIETAGGAANKATLIPALKLNQAEALRSEVFARKQVSVRQQETALQQKIAEKRAAQTVAAAPRFDPQTGQPLVPAEPQPAAPRFDPQTGALLAPAALGAADSFVREVGDETAKLRGVFAESYEESAVVEYEYGLTAKELLLSAISSDNNAVVFVVLIGLVSQASQIVGLFGLEGVAEQAVNYAFNHYLLPTIIGGAIFIFVLTFVLGIISTLVTYGGFKVRRRGGRIEVEHGLLARQYRGVAVTRVQSIEVKEGFIRRRFGYAQLKLLTVDTIDPGSSQQNGAAAQSAGLLIHPFVKRDRIEGILAGLTPEFDARPSQAEFKSLPKVSRRRSINRLAVWPTLLYAALSVVITLILVLVPGVPQNLVSPILFALWGLVAFLFILHLGAALLWYRHAAYACTSSVLTIRQGSYGQVTTIIPRKKIQWAKTHQNPFQRLSKVATISATTAAGIAGTATSLRDLQLEDADAFIDWVRPRKRTSVSL